MPFYFRKECPLNSGYLTIPDGMSPFYIEFEEYFGGYNFGTGNAWLDFKNMKFDFSC
ncbi:hypothetical protein GUK05_04655 [Escherichia coli]|nr:hypothetical protein [Escherichia coli]